MDKIEILGWDLLNFIFKYLKPNDIILISTSINTNFCECVKIVAYSDHLLLNKKHTFENRQPDYNILDFHISKIKYYDDDSYYILLCAKNDLPADLFDKLIISLTKPFYSPNQVFPIYIEQYFDNVIDFGRRSFCQISRNGDAIDKIVLKIVLPKLPVGIKYMSSPYNVINNVKLTISGITFFEYTLTQLERLDFISLFFKSEDNVIYCYMDLGSFFKKSEKKLDFYGLRLCDLDYHLIVFDVQLNHIFSIIENQINPASHQYNKINNLSIPYGILLVKYHKSINILPKPINQIINRWISWNHSCYVCDSIELNMNLKWYYNMDFAVVKKLMLCFDQKVRLNSCFIFVSDFPVFSMLIDKDCVQDKYVFDLDMIKIVSPATTKILIKFKNSVKNIKMDAFFETEQTFMYDNGRAIW